MKSLFAVLLLSSSAYAAENRLAVKLFANDPLTDVQVEGSAKDGKTGLGVGVEYLRQIAPRISLGAEIDQLGRSPNTSDQVVSHLQGRLSGSVLALLGMVRFDLVEPDGRFRPYVSGGLGVASVHLKASGTPAPGFVWTTGGNASKTLVDSTKNAGAFTLRAGADFAITKNLGLGAEMGYLRTTTVKHELTSDGRALFGNATLNGPEASFIVGSSLSYRF